MLVNVNERKFKSKANITKWYTFAICSLSWLNNKLKSIEWNHSGNWTLNTTLNWMYRMPNMNPNPLTEMDLMLVLLFTVPESPYGASFHFWTFYSCLNLYRFFPHWKHFHRCVAQIIGYTRKNRWMISLEFCMWMF